MTNEKQSLVSITQGFIKIMKDAGGRDVDLEDCERRLKTPRRRLYDVVNVLSGVNLLTKSGKSSMRWADVHPQISPGFGSERERELDRLIEKANAELLDLTESELFKKFAYLTTDDLSKVSDGDSKVLYSLSGAQQMNIQMNEKQDEQYPYQLKFSAIAGNEIMYAMFMNDDGWKPYK